MSISAPVASPSKGDAKVHPFLFLVTSLRVYWLLGRVLVVLCEE